jgi:hypothetical protein
MIVFFWDTGFILFLGIRWLTSSLRINDHFFGYCSTGYRLLHQWTTDDRWTLDDHPYNLQHGMERHMPCPMVAPWLQSAMDSGLGAPCKYLFPELLSINKCHFPLLCRGNGGHLPLLFLLVLDWSCMRKLKSWEHIDVLQPGIASAHSFLSFLELVQGSALDWDTAASNKQVCWHQPQIRFLPVK